MDIRAIVVRNRWRDTLMARRMCEAAYVPWEPGAKHREEHEEDRELRRCRVQRYSALETR